MPLLNSSLSDGEREEVKFLAEKVYEYFSNLLTVGFKREEALELTLGYQQGMMMMGNDAKETPA